MKTALLLLVACTGLALACRQTPSRSTPEAVVSAVSGPELYARHCTVCHGDRGTADGPGAAFLFPPARDFSRGLFHWVSTSSGMPSRDDLLRTLRRGVPGSAMPSWRWLEDEELDALADHVLFLARDALAQEVAEDSDDAQVPMGWEDAVARAREVFAPGPMLPPIEEPSLTPELLARGQKVYEQNCALCHGVDGRGHREPAFDLDGTPNWARDFTAGFVGGGADFAALTHRIRAGIPGTAMLPTVLRDDQLVALTAYVRSMIPEGTEERLVQRRGRLVAKRVEALPLRYDDPKWNATAPLAVNLAPLRWNDESVLSANIGALHDGEHLEIRVRWQDPTSDVALFSDVNQPDAFALQFSDAERPPLFGMGGASELTTIWHWKSVRLEDVAGALDLVQVTPHLLSTSRIEDVRTDAPLYHPLLSAPRVSERVDGFEPRGVDQASASRRAPAPGVEVAAHHGTGGWTLVFRRRLELEDELALTPGAIVQVACAAWNGSIGNHGADKSISIWQELEIER